MSEPDAQPSRPRPRFAEAWPQDATLDTLLVAFDDGDYARVRRDGEALAKDATDELVRQAAEELVRRTKPDPLSSLLVIVATALLAFFSFWYLGGHHGH
jgi:hypothetical protein